MEAVCSIAFGMTLALAFRVCLFNGFAFDPNEKFDGMFLIKIACLMTIHYWHGRLIVKLAKMLDKPVSLSLLKNQTIVQ